MTIAAEPRPSLPPAPPAPRRSLPSAPPRRRHPTPRPSPIRGGDLAAFVGVNLVVITAMWVRHGGPDLLATTAGTWQAVGQLAALFGTFAILGELVLISRVPWLERRYGMDRLNGWHRWNGFAAALLLLGHAVATTVGYAMEAGTGLPAQLGDFVLFWPNVLAAMVGFALVAAVTVTSVRAARRSLRYETWHFVHLYAYLGVTLAFAHQLTEGVDFVGDRWAIAYWVGLHLAVVGLLVGFRWITPLVRAGRHDLRVAAVTREAPGVVSLVLTGRHLDRWPVASGQFFLLRFLRGDRWWKAHPLSLSAAPDGRHLRFTVKALGDDTAVLQSIPVGTRVMAEGPYGAFTAARATRRKVALIGGGIGITPLRAIVEDIERAPGEVDVLYRARARPDAILLHELDDITRRRGFGLRVSYSRPHGRPVGPDPFTPSALLASIPDLPTRDVFVCGPPSLVTAACRGLRQAGVPRPQIHAERFDY